MASLSTAHAQKICTHPLGDAFSLSDFHCQSKIRQSAIPIIIQEDILWFHIPVQNFDGMQMQNPTGDLRWVKDDPFHFQTPFSHIVDVIFQIPSIHEAHNKTQMGFGLVGVSQCDYERAVDLLQDLFLQQCHLLSTFLFQPFLIQLFAGIHLASIFDLDGTNLEKMHVEK